MFAVNHIQPRPILLALLLLSVFFAAPAAGRSDPEAGAAASPAAAETPTPEGVAVPDDPVARATTRIRAALSALTAAELLLAGAPATTTADPRDLLETARIELQEALVELGAALEQQRLRAWLDERLPASVESPEAMVSLDMTPVDPVGAVSASTLEEVRRAIESAPFKDDKMQVLRTNLTAARVSSEQVATLLELFTLSSHRVDALVFLHPRITDPEKFGSLLGTLKFESDRQTVLDRLGLGG
jgi:hypothetical protein